MEGKIFEVRFSYKVGKGKIENGYGVLSATSKEQVKDRCKSLYPKCTILEIKDVDDEVEKEWQEANLRKKNAENDIKQKKGEKRINRLELKGSSVSLSAAELKKKKEEKTKMGKCKKGKKGGKGK